MHARSRSILALTAAAPLCLFTAGCSDSSAPRQTPHVEAINDNQPLQSDVVRYVGDNATIAEDAVVIEIWNRPHYTVLNLDLSPYSGVLLERYEITFESSEAIPPVRGALGWSVDLNRVMSGTIIIVPASMKAAPPLVSLRQGGEIQAVAHIRIEGREHGSGEKVSLETVLQVNFANWAD